MLTVTELAFC